MKRLHSHAMGFFFLSRPPNKSRLLQQYRTIKPIARYYRVVTYFLIDMGWIAATLRHIAEARLKRNVTAK